jgi:hypothetical protein
MLLAIGITLGLVAVGLIAGAVGLILMAVRKLDLSGWP